MSIIGKIAICGDGISGAALSRLENYVSETVILPPADYLANPVSNHADMLIFPVGDVIFAHGIYARGAGRNALRRISELTDKKIIEIDSPVSAEYPHDVGLNCAAVGEHLVASKYTCKEIVEYAVSIGMSVIYSAQGYSRCSLVPVGSGAIITADAGIAKAVSVCGTEVLRISEGGVLLPGYNCGFIGGCTGCDGVNVFFNGSPKLHADGEKILGFCAKYGVTAVSLADMQLCDIGSIFFM